MDPADFLIDGPEGAEWTLVLAHGAGAPMDSEFMEHMASGIAERGVRVVRFEFPYMAQRRHGGGKKPPNAPRVLESCWREVIEISGNADRLVIGGKSMGGRIASMVADESGVGGLVCLGYPFHPPGKPDKPRIAHLRNLRTPALFVQGERDTFGSMDEVAAYDLARTIRFVWLRDGDHSFVPRVRSGIQRGDNRNAAIDAIADFVGGL